MNKFSWPFVVASQNSVLELIALNLGHENEIFTSRIVSAHFQNQDSDEAFFIIHYFIGDRDFDKNIN